MLFQKSQIMLSNRWRFHLSRVLGNKDMLKVAMSHAFDTTSSSVLSWPADRESEFAFDVFDKHKGIIRGLRREFGRCINFKYIDRYAEELEFTDREATKAFANVVQFWIDKGKPLPEYEFQGKVLHVFKKYILWLRPSKNYDRGKHSVIVRSAWAKYGF